VDERLAAGDGEIIGVAPLDEEIHFLFKLFQGFVPGHVLAVTSLAMDVANIRHFDPGDRIVVHGPRQTIVFAFFEHFFLPECFSGKLNANAWACATTANGCAGLSRQRPSQWMAFRRAGCAWQRTGELF
jgi:hypothetical protein